MSAENLIKKHLEQKIKSLELCNSDLKEQTDAIYNTMQSIVLLKQDIASYKEALTVLGSRKNG